MMFVGSSSGLRGTAAAVEEGVTNCNRSIQPDSSRAADGIVGATCRGAVYVCGRPPCIAARQAGAQTWLTG
jgi:hypothetical protein